MFDKDKADAEATSRKSKSDEADKIVRGDGRTIEFDGSKYEIKEPEIAGNEGEVYKDGEKTIYFAQTAEVRDGVLWADKLQGRAYILAEVEKEPAPKKSGKKE